ncbi:hypothetical protein TNIN_162471 [Trichonephila inaurata madagascariensis]|uniref:Uncharacterized protein n=1 Tax=Trichonephila inaurata madagascariensis TaxID=2747483 RepID=A0A8X6YT01_9ARAC|nr:hypothetical protein TNIN_162471 [Trichonephila inaurata madagascariensis]
MLSFVQNFIITPRHRPTNWGPRPRFKLVSSCWAFANLTGLIHFSPSCSPFQRFFFKTSRPYPFDFNSPSGVFSQFILEKSPPAILGESSSIPAKISVHRLRISSFQASSHRKSAES